MSDESLHFPGQEPTDLTEEQPKEDAPAPEGEQRAQEQPKGEAPKEEAPKEDPKGEEPTDPPADPPNDPIKKRSIYDDLKDERKDRKGWQEIAISALKAQGHELTGNETIDQLTDLLAKKDDARTPSEKSDVDEELKQFAEAEGLSVDGLKKLTDFLSKRVAGQPVPEDVQKTLKEIGEWKQSIETTQRREQEDREVLAAAPAVKSQLKELGFEIHIESELDTVMKEVLRLSHTAPFHDKEVDYIVYKNRDQLSKLVSPKKSSFEAGGESGEAAAEAEVDFSEGKATPGQAQKAIEQRGHRGGYDIRRA